MKIERSGEHHEQGLPGQYPEASLYNHVAVQLIVSAIMPLYEMLCITTHVSTYVRLFPLFLHTYSNTNLQQHIRELVRQSAMHVINNGGVVRSINSWGTRTLPQKMKRHGPRQSVGE